MENTNNPGRKDHQEIDLGFEEVKNSSVDTCKDNNRMSESLDWSCKEDVENENTVRNEIQGMSGVWDWELKETPRSASSARTKRWENAGGFWPGDPGV